MLTKQIFPALSLFTVMAVTACSESPTGSSTPTASLDTTLEQMAAESNGRGDADAAAAFSGGALAIRLGVTPTEITVSVDGKETRYHAVVTALATTASGTTTVSRALVAWAGDDRPIALLQVNTKGEHGVFGNSDQRASGSWADIPRALRFGATAGSADLKIASIGEACSTSVAAAQDVRCFHARFKVDVDGIFTQLRSTARDGGGSVRIVVAESSVAGVIVTRNAVSATGR